MPGAQEHELAARLEECHVARCIVCFALAHVRQHRIADPLDAGSDKLHVDVAAVCLPDALLRRPSRVVLHEREQVVAVEIVAPGRNRQQVSSA